MQSKAWYLSKSIWVAFFIFVGSILAGTGVIELDLSPEATWIGIAWSIVQFLLRLVTKEPVTLKNEN